MAIDYKIPTFINVQYVQNDGYLTSEMQIYNDSLNRFLQDNLSGNGWRLPTVTQAELAALILLPAPDTPPDGSIWYVSQTAPAYHEIVVKVNGSLFKLDRTAYP